MKIVLRTYTLFEKRERRCMAHFFEAGSHHLGDGALFQPLPLHFHLHVGHFFGLSQGHSCLGLQSRLPCEEIGLVDRGRIRAGVQPQRWKAEHLRSDRHLLFLRLLRVERDRRGSWRRVGLRTRRFRVRRCFVHETDLKVHP